MITGMSSNDDGTDLDDTRPAGFPPAELLNEAVFGKSILIDRLSF